ncbi:MAG TPA: tetratricopeptide repeat protein, partial [Pseudonocardiaceae bacterium]|nr:tetratricopeptide repeat protein [Pseudonocardiaceae bacterium]
QAHCQIYGGDFTVLHGDAPRWHPPRTYVDRLLADPAAWLESEHANLCAMVRLAAEYGLHEHCWDLAVSLVTLFELRCYFSDWERTHHQALAAVRDAGNRRGTAAVLCSLGSLYLTWGRSHTAGELIEPALRMFEELGDAHGTAMARRNLALLQHRLGNRDEAAVAYRTALTEFREAADPVGQAYVLAQIARLVLEAGDEDAAAGRLYEALEICREFGCTRVELQVRYQLSGLMTRQRRFGEADAILTDLLATVRAERDIIGEARILHRSGLVKAELGDLTAAEELFRVALELCEQTMDHRVAAQVRLELALVLADRGGQQEAASLLSRAMTTFSERNMTASLRRAEAALDAIGAA